VEVARAAFVAGALGTVLGGAALALRQARPQLAAPLEAALLLPAPLALVGASVLSCFLIVLALRLRLAPRDARRG